MSRDSTQYLLNEISGRKRSWLFRLTWPVTHYLITNFTVTLGYIFFHVFNRTTVLGRKNVPHKRNILLLSNHQTMIDSFLIGICAFYPTSLYRPSMIPWNPAAEENFYRTPILAWLADNWKCIPIKRGRKDVGSLHKMARALTTSPLILFPEGTRSRDGSIGKARAGAGLLILDAQPIVIPVCIDGMDSVLPIGARAPRIFKRIRVQYGAPLDFTQFYGSEKTKDVAQTIMDRVMESIRVLQGNLPDSKGGASPG